jgi:ankyrin repeat protein
MENLDKDMLTKRLWDVLLNNKFVKGKFTLKKLQQVKSFDEPILKNLSHEFTILINKGADVDYKDVDGNTLINLLIDRGNWKVNEFTHMLLSKRKLDFNDKNNNGQTTLMIAAKNDHNLIEFLLKKPMDINLQDNSGNTALSYLCMNSGKLKNFKNLIDAGAKIDLQDVEGNTPLMYLFDSEELQIDDLVYATKKCKDVNFSIKNNKGKTMISLLAEKLSNGFEFNLAVTRYIEIKEEIAKLKLIRPDSYNRNESLGTDVKHDLMGKIKNKKEFDRLEQNEKERLVRDVLRYCGEDKAVLNLKDESGLTPIMNVCYNKNKDSKFVFKTLLEEGSDVEIKDNNNKTLLHHIKKNKRNDLLKIYENNQLQR